ncbi:MAG: EAL domain-containing protein, partial [Spirochaetia bacterium]|nr:EAL domain-containing protein [Spirochaetia bacterium]
YFQPILNNHSRQIEKYETLVRLQGTDGKIIAPGLFLPIAKKTKLYGGISKRVIEKSFEALLASDMEFSINLSADDILNEETTAFLFATLKNCAGSSGACSRLVFEILESEGIESYEIVSDFIRKVKVFGCKVAIDDFGTGYSNFEHLLRLQVDYIKIDASLIRTLDSDRNSQILVENIVDFSNKLGILTIAEFVHSQSVLEKVRELGVHFSQGYHIGEPKAHLVI